MDNTQQLFVSIIYLKKFVLAVVVALPSYMLKVPINYQGQVSVWEWRNLNFLHCQLNKNVRNLYADILDLITVHRHVCIVFSSEQPIAIVRMSRDSCMRAHGTSKI